MASPHPPVEAEIARLRREGYVVEEQVEDQITLVKQRSWRSHWLGAVFAGLTGGGINPSARTQRLYLWVDRDGGARLRLAPRATNPPVHLA
jgi:hypothetical protein